MDYKTTYDEMFNIPRYNKHLETEPRYVYVMEYIKSKQPKSILDVGSGRGWLIGMLLNTYKDIKIHSADLAKYHEHNVEFSTLDLSKKDTYTNVDNLRVDLLTCLDVLEHIEEKYIDDILCLFSSISNNIILSIANHSDVINGKELHLVQKGMDFWRPRLEKYFIIEDLRQEYGGKLHIVCMRRI